MDYLPVWLIRFLLEAEQILTLLPLVVGINNNMFGVGKLQLAL